MNNTVKISRPVLIYTMTSGLGDFIILGDLVRKIEDNVPESTVLIIHRSNPHVKLWRQDEQQHFFNTYSGDDLKRFFQVLICSRRTGRTVFGLQMAPGSLQGFILYSLLKRIGLVNYIVDFNLINADIITPRRGDYILDIHLDQVADLLKCPFHRKDYQLEIPFKFSPAVARHKNQGLVLGIHPWSRRGDQPAFVWPKENWFRLLKHVAGSGAISQIVLFGKDGDFTGFFSLLRERCKGESYEGKITAVPSGSVEELAQTVAATDLLLSVNTSVVHLGYALNKKMVILCGPTLDLWIPKGEGIRIVRDEEALFTGADRWVADERFASVSRISVEQVVAAMDDVLNLQAGSSR